MKSNRSMLYALGFVFVIAFVVIYAAQKTTLLNPTVVNNTNSDNLTETATTTTNTNTPTYENPASPSPQPAPYAAQEPEKLSEAARIQRIEIEKTKELNQKNVALIRAQMLQEELTSLQASIQNDERLLKEIEALGTGADDYRYIENNLKKRRARLKELTEK